ncbi:endonuclease/exonuclease/phosphatase family protein [Rhodococcus sp. X156]|uniref:endonuclease/exonuclease/phosphatase family protein n=1 Tax=Rhodococcus sp. X156 TaxID=2499145 RepID=UPI000FD83E95|nr:endonuclease/exonuclease/phosphatase family protein [Rhodococcus sp. X156]
MSTAAPGHDPLLVMTFNLWQLRLRGSRHRAELALQAILDASPDVVVLNEAFNRPSRALVAQLRSAGYHCSPYLGGVGGRWAGVSGRRRGVRRLVGGGVFVLSRLPLQQCHQHVYRAVQRRTTSSVLENKGVVLVALGGAGAGTWVAGTHLQADERGDAHQVRMAQLAELRALVTATVPPEHTVVLAGDLNVAARATDGRWAQACRVLGGLTHGQLHEPTFDATRNPLTAAQHPGVREVLDHVGVLHRDGAAPRLRVSSTTLAPAADREASDHFPVLATITATASSGFTQP